MKKYVAVIEEPVNRSLPMVSLLRRMTQLDRLLWRVFRKKPRCAPRQPVAYHGLAIKLQADVAQTLYGLANPDDCVCDVVAPHPIPEPPREEDMP